MAQIVDFSFDLTVPLTADNALYVEGLYFDYADYDPSKDYDYYMAQFAELNKFEVHFQCVEDPTASATLFPDPKPEPETIDNKHCSLTTTEDGITTITTTKGLNEVAFCHHEIRCPAGHLVERNIASIKGLQDCQGCIPDQQFPEKGWLDCDNNYEHNVFRLAYTRGGDDVTETFCSENESENIQPTVEKGTWVNTMAQAVDFSFDLRAPLTAENAMPVMNLYFDYADYDPSRDFDTYIAQMDEWSKFEVHFKCVKEPEPEPTPEPIEVEGCTVRDGKACPLVVEENNGVTTISMVDNQDTAVGFTRRFSCEYGDAVQAKIVTISGLGTEQEGCWSWLNNYLQFEYRKFFKAFVSGLFQRSMNHRLWTIVNRL